MLIRRRVVQDGSGDGLRQSHWAQMPQELLREVLLRIEASEVAWPTRKMVVACAGVCRSWRQITKEIVKTPQLSGNLTFPISLKQPGPREYFLKCFMKRHRSTQTYFLFLSLADAQADYGKFLLAARKCRHATCTDYIISLDPDNMLEGNSTYIGKLRSSFLGTNFTIFDRQLPHVGAEITRLANLEQVSPQGPVGNYPVAHISYESNLSGSRGSRRIQCIMDCIPSSATEPGGVLVLKNRPFRWHEQFQSWYMNFHDARVTVPSVKNFQLVASPKNGPSGLEHENIILQFAKVRKDLFTMDYRYPISAFQAFAICLSSIDTKIGCQ